MKLRFSLNFALFPENMFGVFLPTSLTSKEAFNVQRKYFFL